MNLSSKIFFDNFLPRLNEITTEITTGQIEKQLANIKQITFECTEHCNLRCSYCGYGEYYANRKERTKKALNISDVSRLLDFLHDLFISDLNHSKIKTIAIGYYGGEPLLNSRFIMDCVDYLKKWENQYLRFVHTITTNGTLLNKYIDYLVENDFIIYLSLDGDKSNNKYRVKINGNESFDTVIKNVKTIEKRYPEYFASNIFFNSVLHKKNSVLEICEFFKTQFNKTPKILELNTTGIKKEKRALFNLLYKNLNESIHQNEKSEFIATDLFTQDPNIKHLALFIHKYSGSCFNSFRDLLCNVEKSSYYPTGTCFPFERKIFVTSNGEILPCEKISDHYKLGTVSKSNLNLDLYKITEYYTSLYKQFKPQCEKCCRLMTCIQCMFQFDNLKETLKCPGFLGEKEFQNTVDKEMAFMESHPEYYERIINNLLFL